MRVAPEFKIFTNALSVIVDPKEFDAKSFVEFEGEVCVVPPNSFAPGAIDRILPDSPQRSDHLRRQERLRPLRHHHQRHPLRARVGGHVTLEISNTTPLPRRSTPTKESVRYCSSRPDDDDVCETSYADKKGKYQAQRGVTLPRL
jgi:dCTP deaminase